MLGRLACASPQQPSPSGAALCSARPWLTRPCSSPCTGLLCPRAADSVLVGLGIVARGERALRAPRAAPRRLQAGLGRLVGGPQTHCGQSRRQRRFCGACLVAIASSDGSACLLCISSGIDLPYMVTCMYDGPNAFLCSFYDIPMMFSAKNRAWRRCRARHKIHYSFVEKGNPNGLVRIFWSYFYDDEIWQLLNRGMLAHTPRPKMVIYLPSSGVRSCHFQESDSAARRRRPRVASAQGTPRWSASLVGRRGTLLSASNLDEPLVGERAGCGTFARTTSTPRRAAARWATARRAA